MLIAETKSETAVTTGECNKGKREFKSIIERQECMIASKTEHSKMRGTC